VTRVDIAVTAALYVVPWVVLWLAKAGERYARRRHADRDEFQGG
jgi:hypothetical protein